MRVYAIKELALDIETIAHHCLCCIVVSGVQMLVDTWGQLLGLHAHHSCFSLIYFAVCCQVHTTEFKFL